MNNFLMDNPIFGAAFIIGLGLVSPTAAPPARPPSKNGTKNCLSELIYVGYIFLYGYI